MLFKYKKTEEEMRAQYPSVFAEAPKNTTSDKYLYIPTHKLISGLETNGFQVAGIKQANSRSESKEFSKHVVYMTRGELSRDSAKVGDEFPLLALTNSHNGLSSFKIDTAFFRLACSNGLLLPSSAINSARITHKIGMERDVIDASYKVVDSFDSQIKLIESMKAKELSTDESMLLAESAANLVFDADQIELNKSRNIDLRSKLLTTRRYDDRKSDLWTTFNKIQENVIKGGIRVLSKNDRGELSLKKTRSVNSIDRDAKLNQEIMSLAIKFNELKGA
jgi:hypothetical protein